VTSAVRRRKATDVGLKAPLADGGRVRLLIVAGPFACELCSRPPQKAPTFNDALELESKTGQK
jgi:hypothetical protein